MERQLNYKFKKSSGELNDLLENVLAQIQEQREGFTSALDGLEDMGTES